MRDTPPEVEQRMHEMMRAKTPEERAMMVGEMFHAAREIARAGVRAQQPALTPAEERVALFLRFYADDFPPEELARICRYLSAPT